MTIVERKPGLSVERQGNVTILVLDDPERRNPLGSATIRALTAVLREADIDPEIGAVVVTGRGGTFSAGADLEEFRSTLGATPPVHWETAEPWIDLFDLVPSMTKPVVAAVDGPALAGGCGLVALCDLAIASERATFGTPEVTVGLFPLVILPALVRAVGQRHALALALTGRPIDARQAERIGLVHRVVPAEELESEAMALAKHLAKQPRFTVRLGKHIFYRIAELDYAAGLDLARAIRGTFLASDELRRGTEAFFTRRRDRTE